MTGIKNFSDAVIAHSFDGMEYKFQPKEIKVLPPHVAQHLVGATYTCALGASPLRLIAEKDVPAELTSTPQPVAPDLAVLRNGTEADIDVAEDGRFYTIPAGKTCVLPALMAKSIHERFVLARRTGLYLEKAAPLPEAVSAGPEEHAPAHDSPVPSFINAPEEKVKRQYKRKNK